MSEFRKHAKLMVQFAMDPDALAFVLLGTVGPVEYYILTDLPLWEDDREYQVRSDFSLKNAQEDRAVTIAQFAEDKEKNDALVDSLIEAAEELR